MSKKPAWLYRQSGVFPFRFNGTEIEILLITTRKHQKWSIPKGVVEKDMSPLDSASKEAFEEAGITGEIHSKSTGSYHYYKLDGICTVELFLLKVTNVLKDWTEAHFRKRCWMSVE